MVSVRHGIGSVMVIELDTCGCTHAMNEPRKATSCDIVRKSPQMKPPDCNSAEAASSQPAERWHWSSSGEDEEEEQEKGASKGDAEREQSESERERGRGG